MMTYFISTSEVKIAEYKPGSSSSLYIYLKIYQNFLCFCGNPSKEFRNCLMYHPRLHSCDALPMPPVPLSLDSQRPDLCCIDSIHVGETIVHIRISRRTVSKHPLLRFQKMPCFPPVLNC